MRAYLVLSAERGDVLLEVGANLAALLLQEDELLVELGRHQVVAPSTGSVEGRGVAVVGCQSSPSRCARRGHFGGGAFARTGRRAAHLSYSASSRARAAFSAICASSAATSTCGERGREGGAVSPVAPKARGVGANRPKCGSPGEKRDGETRAHPGRAPLGVVNQRQALLHVEALGPGEAVAPNRRQNHRDGVTSGFPGVEQCSGMNGTATRKERRCARDDYFWLWANSSRRVSCLEGFRDPRRAPLGTSAPWSRQPPSPRRPRPRPRAARCVAAARRTPRAPFLAVAPRPTPSSARSRQFLRHDLDDRHPDPTRATSPILTLAGQHRPPHGDSGREEEG